MTNPTDQILESGKSETTSEYFERMRKGEPKPQPPQDFGKDAAHETESEKMERLYKRIPHPSESFAAVDKAIKTGKPVRKCYQCGAGLTFEWPSDYCSKCRPVREAPAQNICPDCGNEFGKGCENSGEEMEFKSAKYPNVTRADIDRMCHDARAAVSKMTCAEKEELFRRAMEIINAGKPSPQPEPAKDEWRVVGDEPGINKFYNRWLVFIRCGHLIVGAGAGSTQKEAEAIAKQICDDHNEH